MLIKLIYSEKQNSSVYVQQVHCSCTAVIVSMHMGLKDVQRDLGYCTEGEKIFSSTSAEPLSNEVFEVWSFLGRGGKK